MTEFISIRPEKGLPEVYNGIEIPSVLDYDHLNEGFQKWKEKFVNPYTPLSFNPLIAWNNVEAGIARQVIAIRIHGGHCEANQVQIGGSRGIKVARETILEHTGVGGAGVVDALWSLYAQNRIPKGVPLHYSFAGPVNGTRVDGTNLPAFNNDMQSHLSDLVNLTQGKNPTTVSNDGIALAGGLIAE